MLSTLLLLRARRSSSVENPNPSILSHPKTCFFSFGHPATRSTLGGHQCDCLLKRKHGYDIMKITGPVDTSGARSDRSFQADEGIARPGNDTIRMAYQ